MTDRPLVAIDHVLIGVADLSRGARHLEQTYGLKALPGGRHPGIGTGNMIVPLGSSYLELIAVVEPREAGSPSAQRVARTVREGRTFVTWAARTDRLDALQAHLRELGVPTEIQDGARTRPDGVSLRWRTLPLVPFSEPSVLPFIIEWNVPPGQHPAAAAVEHPSGARGIQRLRLGDPKPAEASRRLASLLGEGVAAFAAVEFAETPGVLAVEIDTPGGVVTIT
ncbi:MAG TPA: VOC family protein [bacterium]|nr:VOC family protein [bacterium]